MTSSRPSRPVLLAFALAAALTPPLGAQDLPLAAVVIDRYVEALGGHAAASARMATRVSGVFEMPAMGVRGDLVTVTGVDGAMATRVTIPAMGEILTGYTGEVGWSLDPATGPRLLAGDELTAMQEQADTRYRVRDAALYQSRTTVGENTFADEACWEVEFVWLSGRTTSECFSKDSGLLIASVRTQASALGEVEVVSLAQEYVRFGDLLYPTVLRQVMMGREQVMRLVDVEIGEVDLSLLQPPPSIQALIDARD